MTDRGGELRGRIAGVLAHCARLGPAKSEASREEAVGDTGFADAIVQAFVDEGGYSHPFPATRRVRLEDLEALPYAQELEDALDRRRGQRDLQTQHQLRLGKLYALIGRHEKAASCFREVLARPEPPPMSLVIELSEAAARSGKDSIALAGVDRVAETILTRDADEALGEDLLRDDPLSAGAMLERARDIALQIDQAPRAVALGRAATALYERLGRAAEIRGSLAGQVRAMQAAGNAKRARVLAERWRDMSRDGGAAIDEAAALETLANQKLTRGQFGEAVTLLTDAAEVFEELADLPSALRLAQRQGTVLLQDGLLAEARQVLIDSREQASRGNLPELAREIEAQRIQVELADAEIAEAIRSAEALQDDWAQAGDLVGASAAGVLLGEALVLAGDGSAAIQAVAKYALDRPGGATEARALAVLAQAAAMAERWSESRLLLVSASRLAREARAAGLAAELHLLRGELALSAGDEEFARLDLAEAERLGAQGRVEVQLELLQARLADDEDAEMILDELADSVRGGLQDQIKIQGARQSIGRGVGMMGEDPAVALVERLRAVRDELPKAFWVGFTSSPLCQPLLIGRDDDPLAALRAPPHQAEA